MSRHLAFFGFPGYGHVKPTLGVVEELVRRGHRVTYVVADRYADVVAGTGADVLAYRSSFPELVDTDDMPRFVAAFTREGFAPLVPAVPRFAADPPDLVAFDVLVGNAAGIVARRHGVPTVRLHAGFGGNDRVPYDRVDPDDAPAGGEIDPTHPELVGLGAEIEDMLESAGVADQLAHESLSTPDKGDDLEIAFVPRAFQIGAEHFAEDFLFAGPCLRQRDFVGDWTPPGNGHRIALVSLGTSNNSRAEFFRACADAFAGLPWHVVMTLGRNADPARLGPWPENVEAHPWVPHLTVLGHASVCVNQAGTGSVMEALHCGVPLVVVPQAPDSEVAAHQVVTLGLGQRLDPDGLTPESLREAILAVADDPAIRANTRAMSAQVRASGGAAEAADRVEALLA